jgi:hypothetical protein
MTLMPQITLINPFFDLRDQHSSVSSVVGVSGQLPIAIC